MNRIFPVRHISTDTFALVVILLSLWGCSSSHHDPEVVLSINPSISEYMADNTTSSFASGDAIGLFASSTTTASKAAASTTQLITNRQFSYNGSGWSSADTSWPNTAAGATYDFTAYYPYDANATSTKFVYTCPADQSSAEKIHKTDFVYGTSSSLKSDVPVPIKMSHLFSIITLNVKYGSNVSDIVSGVTIKASNLATVDLAAGSASTTTATNDISMGLLSTPATGYVKTYSCILPPQKIAANAIVFKFTDGTSKTLQIDDQSLWKNMRVNVNTTVVGNKEILVNGVTVSPWETVDIQGGKVTEVHDYKTGDVITYLKNRTTNPVTIVVIPEGFTQSQLTYEGLFEQKARAAMDFFFNVEPYKTYKNYFNVYFIAAVSKEQGADSIASTGHAAHLHDTYFDAGWEWDGNYSMKANSATVMNFVSQYCPDIVNGNTTLENVAVFMIINDARYGGITYTWSDGKAFAMCPLTAGSLRWAGKTPSVTGYSNGDWRNTLVHEGGGHCFGKLDDEYWYDNTKTYTSKVISSHYWGTPFGLNVTADTTSTSTTFYWKHMIGTGTGKFPKEGLYEGGGGSYAKGIWRPEIVSCMIDNRRYFNAWSRYLIAKRILSLAGETISYDAFLSKDVNYDEILDASKNSSIRQDAFSRTDAKIYPPLPHPIMMP